MDYYGDAVGTKVSGRYRLGGRSLEVAIKIRGIPLYVKLYYYRGMVAVKRGSTVCINYRKKYLLKWSTPHTYVCQW
jgi:hypothetical protein